jgi:hypothetical protein
MNVLVHSVDHEPDDLGPQLPLRGRLLQRIAGPPRRPEYWLAELCTPVSWTMDGVSREVRYLVLAARWQGTSIGAGGHLPVNIWYVTDDAVVEADSFESSQAEYVAIGMARISPLPMWWLRMWTFVSTGI